MLVSILAGRSLRLAARQISRQSGNVDGQGTSSLILNQAIAPEQAQRDGHVGATHRRKARKLAVSLSHRHGSLALPAALLALAATATAKAHALLTPRWRHPVRVSHRSTAQS